MVCRLCQERGKTWEGSDPRCAFVGGVFTTDNWNCATMNRLRDMTGELEDKGRADTFYFRDDMDAGTIGVLRVVGMKYSGYIVMTWYKRRGRVGQAVFMSDDDEPIKLTLDIAEDAIGTYREVHEANGLLKRAEEVPGDEN